MSKAGILWQLSLRLLSPLIQPLPAFPSQFHISLIVPRSNLTTQRWLRNKSQFGNFPFLSWSSGRDKLQRVFNNKVNNGLFSMQKLAVKFHCKCFFTISRNRVFQQSQLTRTAPWSEHLLWQSNFSLLAEISHTWHSCVNGNIFLGIKLNWNYLPAKENYTQVLKDSFVENKKLHLLKKTHYKSMYTICHCRHSWLNITNFLFIVFFGTFCLRGVYKKIITGLFVRWPVRVNIKSGKNSLCGKVNR